MSAAITLAAISVPVAAMSQTDADAVMDLFAQTCLTATPPGLLAVPPGYEAHADRETFAGPAELYWTRPNTDGSTRVGVTFTATTRSCEFAVDDRALDAAALQSIGARAILGIQAMAQSQGAAADATAPENIPTFRWIGIPADFSTPFEHRFEVFQSQTQTLIRGVITTTH